MLKRTERQIAERITKTAKLASWFDRENTYTWKREELEEHLVMVKKQQEEENAEDDIWFIKEIVRTETAIQYLKELEDERRKYDELRSHLTALTNVY